MIPTVSGWLLHDVRPGRAAGVSVIVGLIATMAPTVGPTLGGILTSAFSWHWLFLINLPIGIVITAVVWAIVDVDEPDWSLLDGIDILGLVLMATFLGSTEYVLEEGSRKGLVRRSFHQEFCIHRSICRRRILHARAPARATQS